MIKVAFCDDDLSVLNEISGLLDQYRVEHNRDIAYSAFHSPLELLAEIEKGMRVDILFLDVIMPGENGINVAKEIREYDSNVKIIFLTSSSEFAVQSYTVGAYFYQLKPIWAESFFRLMDSVISECKKEQEFSLILRCKTGITRIELSRLIYCEVLGRTLLFYLENGKVVERVGSMDELCDQLAQYESFLRPHRSFLVNMEYVQNISHRAITLSNLTEIPIPHGKCSEIKNKYLDYVFRRKQVCLP
ncbi:MAG: response regulator transcription factor [Lachnospiraceae bacterium]|nr:response regulator transcription factor [Lachnospiraceae bacterium]